MPKSTDLTPEELNHTYHACTMFSSALNRNALTHIRTKLKGTDLEVIVLAAITAEIDGKSAVMPIMIVIPRGKVDNYVERPADFDKLTPEQIQTLRG